MSEYYFTKDELYHHGIKGQKWGIRRFQNPDGSLTAAGKERYTFSDKDKARYQQLKSKRIKNQFQATEQIRLHNKQQRLKNLSKEDMQKEIKEHDAQVAKNKEKLKKAAIIGVAVAGTALAAYGAYKVGKLKIDRANAIIEGRKLCTKQIADNERELYKQAFDFYQAKDRLPEDRPVNRISDPSDLYPKMLRKDMLRAQKNMTYATKSYNEADKASKSNNFNKLKTAYKYAKEGSKNKKEYNDLLENANNWIDRDRNKRSFYSSKDPIDISLRRRSNKRR